MSSFTLCHVTPRAGPEDLAITNKCPGIVDLVELKNKNQNLVWPWIYRVHGTYKEHATSRFWLLFSSPSHTLLETVILYYLATFFLHTLKERLQSYNDASQQRLCRHGSGPICSPHPSIHRKREPGWPSAVRPTPDRLRLHAVLLYLQRLPDHQPQEPLCVRPRYGPVIPFRFISGIITDSVTNHKSLQDANAQPLPTSRL